MTDNTAERLEILVHSAASTTKKEDDQFRAQALACLGFQPAKTTPLSDIIFTGNRALLNEGDHGESQKLRGSQSQTKRRREEGSQPQEAETKRQYPRFSTTKFTSRTRKPTPRGSLEDFESSPECIIVQCPECWNGGSFF